MKRSSRVSATLEAKVIKLERFWLYETISFFYLVGFNNLETEFRMLKINRRIEKPNCLADILFVDELIYSKEELFGLLDMISEGNKVVGGITKVCSGFGIVGFVKFLDCYYLNMVTQVKEVGFIGGNYIYSIKATEMLAIKPKPEVEKSAFSNIWKKLNQKLNQSSSDIAESRYMGLFLFVDMTKDFFFSYSYDLTSSLQHNYIRSLADDPVSSTYSQVKVSLVRVHHDNLSSFTTF